MKVNFLHRIIDAPGFKITGATLALASKLKAGAKMVIPHLNGLVTHFLSHKGNRVDCTQVIRGHNAVLYRGFNGYRIDKQTEEVIGGVAYPVNPPRYVARLETKKAAYLYGGRNGTSIGRLYTDTAPHNIAALVMDGPKARYVDKITTLFSEDILTGKIAHVAYPYLLTYDGYLCDVNKLCGCRLGVANSLALLNSTDPNDAMLTNTVYMFGNTVPLLSAFSCPRFGDPLAKFPTNRLEYTTEAAFTRVYVDDELNAPDNNSFVLSEREVAIGYGVWAYSEVDLTPLFFLSKFVPTAGETTYSMKGLFGGDIDLGVVSLAASTARFEIITTPGAEERALAVHSDRRTFGNTTWGSFSTVPYSGAARFSYFNDTAGFVPDKSTNQSISPTSAVLVLLQSTVLPYLYTVIGTYTIPYSGASNPPRVYGKRQVTWYSSNVTGQFVHRARVVVADIRTGLNALLYEDPLSADLLSSFRSTGSQAASLRAGAKDCHLVLVETTLINVAVTGSSNGYTHIAPTGNTTDWFFHLVVDGVSVLLLSGQTTMVVNGTAFNSATCTYPSPVAGTVIVGVGNHEWRAAFKYDGVNYAIASFNVITAVVGSSSGGSTAMLALINLDTLSLEFMTPHTLPYADDTKPAAVRYVVVDGEVYLVSLFSLFSISRFVLFHEVVTRFIDYTHSDITYAESVVHDLFSNYSSPAQSLPTVVLPSFETVIE